MKRLSLSLSLFHSISPSLSPSLTRFLSLSLPIIRRPFRWGPGHAGVATAALPVIQPNNRVCEPRRRERDPSRKRRGGEGRCRGRVEGARLDRPGHVIARASTYDDYRWALLDHDREISLSLSFFLCTDPPVPFQR